MKDPTEKCLCGQYLKTETKIPWVTSEPAWAGIFPIPNLVHPTPNLPRSHRPHGCSLAGANVNCSSSNCHKKFSAGDPRQACFTTSSESLSIQMEFRFKPQSDQGFTVLSTFIHFVDFNPLPAALIHCTSQRITWVVDQPGVGEAGGILFSREPKAGPTT